MQTIPEAQLESIIKILPQAEELKAINREKGDKETVATWGPVEKFVDYVGNGVPDLTRRMTLWMFMIEFDTYVCELERELEELGEAARQLLNESNRFYDVLTIVLQLGNLMNAGTQYGNTQGFTIADLAQLENLRMTDGTGRNLLSFIVSGILDGAERHAERKEETLRLLSWDDDVALLRQVKVTTSGISQGVTQLGQGLRTIKRAVDEKKRSQSVFGEENVQDVLVERLSKFYASSEPVCLALEASFTAVKDSMDEVAGRFGEDAASLDETAFVQTVLAFAKSFQHAVAEERKHRAAQAKKAARQPNSTLSIKQPAKPPVKAPVKPAVKQAAPAPPAAPSPVPAPTLPAPAPAGEAAHERASKPPSAATKPSLKKSRQLSECSAASTSHRDVMSI